MRSIRTAGVFASAAIAAFALADSAQGAFPGPNGKIAFQSRPGGDPGADLEIYTINPDGSGLANLTNSPGDDFNPSWSANGNYIVFESLREAVNGAQIYWMRADGTKQTHVPFPERGSPRFSADGTEIAFNEGHSLALIQSDGADWRSIDNSLPAQSISWGNGSLVYDHYDPATQQTDIYKIDYWGTFNQALTSGPDSEQFPDWSPNGNKIVFQLDDPVGSRDGIYTMNFNGVDVTPVPSTSLDQDPAYSPDGTKLVVRNSGGGIDIVDPVSGAHTPLASSGASPDWGRTPIAPVDGYAGPKGATPLDVHLVPAYRGCYAPNERHGAPLAVDSCSPPQERSDYLTVGTLDANGQPAKFVGSVRFEVHPGDAATPADEADIGFSATLKDVRCKTSFPTCEGGPLADYGGTLQATETLRVTDSYNGPARPEYGPGTIQDSLRLPFTIPCTGTSDPTVGSTCSLTSTVESVAAGVVKEGVRSNWQLGDVQVLDGGSDGASPDESTIFAVQGVFVP
jgi:WD40-like Beta Propeller Repeat